MRLSCKDVCENALQTAIHCTNINCSRCCCCLQWERRNGAEERKQWLREESLRPGRRKAGKGERPEKRWQGWGRIFSSLDTEQQRRTALVGEPGEARSLRAAGAAPQTQNSRGDHGHPRAEHQTIRTGSSRPRGPAQGPSQAWPSCPGLTLTMA